MEELVVVPIQANRFWHLCEQVMLVPGINSREPIVLTRWGLHKGGLRFLNLQYASQ